MYVTLFYHYSPIRPTICYQFLLFYLLIATVAKVMQVGLWLVVRVNKKNGLGFSHRKTPRSFLLYNSSNAPFAVRKLAINASRKITSITIQLLLHFLYLCLGCPPLIRHTKDLVRYPSNQHAVYCVFHWGVFTTTTS